MRPLSAECTANLDGSTTEVGIKVIIKLVKQELLGKEVLLMQNVRLAEPPAPSVSFRISPHTQPSDHD
jgi:hypothetical protein